MEMENRWASKGLSGTALGLAIGALGAEAMRGGFTGILGGGGNSYCHEDHSVNRYEAAQQARISELETEVKLRDANTFTMGELNKLRENLRDYVDHRYDCLNASINAQAVYNATNTAALNCIQGQVAQLMGLVKLVLPNSSICPGWGDVNVSVTPATTGA